MASLGRCGGESAIRSLLEHRSRKVKEGSVVWRLSKRRQGFFRQTLGAGLVL
jgi:hypothetical protein